MAHALIFGSALWNDATGELPEAEETMDLEPGITPVGFVVPASRYGDYVLRESAVLCVVALTVGGLTFFVVRRRRPY